MSTCTLTLTDPATGASTTIEGVSMKLNPCARAVVDLDRRMRPFTFEPRTFECLDFIGKLAPPPKKAQPRTDRAHRRTKGTRNGQGGGSRGRGV